MSQWYYTRKGEREGPVERGTLDMLVQSGELKPDDLVWTEGMGDWKPASTVEGLFAPPPPDPANPYASPASMTGPAPDAGGAELEIIDPPARLSVGGPLDLAMRILKKDFGMILAAGVVYIGVILGVQMVIGMIASLFHLTQPPIISPAQSNSPEEVMRLATEQIVASYTGWQLVIKIILQIISVYMGLGLARVALDVIEGKPVRIGRLFSQGGKVAGAFGGMIFLQLATLAPLVASLIPLINAIRETGAPTAAQATGFGIGSLATLALSAYLYAKFGFFQAAMVDRNMGVVEAFRESSRLTRGNKWTVIGLILVIWLITLAGFLMLCIGVIFTIPLTTLAWFIAYKWMLHGPQALHRVHPAQPGTTTPVSQ